jgi:hypothetical protein
MRQQSLIAITQGSVIGRGLMHEELKLGPDTNVAHYTISRAAAQDASKVRLTCDDVPRDSF